MDNEKSYENTVEFGQKYYNIILPFVDNEIPGTNPSTHRSGRALKHRDNVLRVKKVE